jgi:ABC-type uncharacterized transport system substrate-binding protein
VLKGDVIVTTNTQAAAAAQNQTMTIPIVVIGVADPFLIKQETRKPTLFRLRAGRK